MNTKVSTKPITHPEYKLYKKRWLMLGIFILYAFNNGLHWIQFSIINDIIKRYYGVSATQVEWTTNIFFLSYILLITPSLYMIGKVGLRNMMIIGATGITIGTWIKVFSVAPDKFLWVMIGQFIMAISLLLTFGLAARFTALWFSASEISITGALALFGDQVGTALGFFLPPMCVKDDSPEIVEKGLRTMHFWIASYSIIVWILVILFFESEPRLPPSAAQAKQKLMGRENVFKSLANIFQKRGFIVIFISYGVNLGCFAAIVTLLDELILINFPNRVSDAGNIGLIMIVFGMIGSIVIGKFLDKTRLFKECAMFIAICATISAANFALSLKSNSIIYVYVVAVFFGFFVVGYYATGFQIGIEITYPVSEEISSAIMLLSAHMSGFVISIVYGYAVKLFGDFYSNIGLTVLYLIPAICAALIPRDLKRQEAEKSMAKVNVKEEEIRDLI